MREARGRPALSAGTFVDSARFAGTCCRAPSRCSPGLTSGFARAPGDGARRRRHGRRKEIFVRELAEGAAGAPARDGLPAGRSARRQAGEATGAPRLQSPHECPAGIPDCRGAKGRLLSAAKTRRLKMRMPQPDRDPPADAVAALIAEGEAAMERQAKGAASKAGGHAVKVVSHQDELDCTPKPVTGIDHRQVQEDIKEMLQRKLDVGRTLHGRREDGTLVAATKDGERVIDRFPAVG